MKTRYSKFRADLLSLGINVREKSDEELEKIVCEIFESGGSIPTSIPISIRELMQSFIDAIRIFAKRGNAIEKIAEQILNRSKV